MSHATAKSLSAFVALAMAFTACNTDNAEQQQAQSLLDQAQALTQDQLYDSAVVILDSLCHAYPRQFDLVKQAMTAKARNLELDFTLQLQQTDSLIAQCKDVVEQMSPLFKYVKTEDMVEGYRVLRSLDRYPLVNRTGVEPRVDDAGNFYLVSLLNGTAAKHDHLTVCLRNNRSVIATTDTIPFDGARNYRFSDINGVSSEMISFHSDECFDLCRFIADNPDGQILLTFAGSRSHSITLDQTTQKAIATTLEFSQAITTGLHAEAKRIHLLKKIEVAQRQQQSQPQ